MIEFWTAVVTLVCLPPLAFFLYRVWRPLLRDADRP